MAFQPPAVQSDCQASSLSPSTPALRLPETSPKAGRLPPSWAQTHVLILSPTPGCTQIPYKEGGCQRQGQKLQKARNVDFAVYWQQRLPSQEGKGCQGPHTGLSLGQQHSLCSYTRAASLNMTILPHPPLFKDLDDGPLGSQDITGANHCPHSHLLAHLPPRSNHPGRSS